jgi:hypothetical protein
MTDETATNRPAQPGRGKLRRNPATLDLTATSVGESTPGAAGTDSASSSAAETPQAESSPAEGASGDIETAAAADSPETATETPTAAAESEPPPGAAEPQSPAASPWRDGFSTRVLALAAVLGGVAGALVTIAVQPMVMPVDNTTARLAVIERALATRQNGVPRNDFEALNGRVSDLTSQLAKLGQDLAATRDKADQTANRIGALESSPGTSQAGVPPEAVQALEQRLGALESAVRSIDPQRLAASSSEAVDRSQRIGRLTAQALLAEDVLGRVRRGDVFAPALDRLAELGVADDRLRPLRSAAAAGVPSLASLRDQFAGLADRISEPGEPPAANADVESRLLAGIRGLVRIRPIDSESQSATAGVGAVQQALADGDAAGALAAWRKLPERARQASADWAAGLERRVTAEAAAQKLVDESVGALAAAPQGSATGAGARP